MFNWGRGFINHIPNPNFQPSVVAQESKMRASNSIENIEKYSLVEVPRILCIFSYFVFSGETVVLEVDHPKSPGIINY